MGGPGRPNTNAKLQAGLRDTVGSTFLAGWDRRADKRQVYVHFGALAFSRCSLDGSLPSTAILVMPSI